MWSIKEPEIDQDTRSEETFALRDTLVTIRNIADNIPLSYKTINIPISGGKFVFLPLPKSLRRADQ